MIFLEQTGKGLEGVLCPLWLRKVLKRLGLQSKSLALARDFLYNKTHG